MCSQAHRKWIGIRPLILRTVKIEKQNELRKCFYNNTIVGGERIVNSMIYWFMCVVIKSSKIDTALYLRFALNSESILLYT